MRGLAELLRLKRHYRLKWSEMAEVVAYAWRFSIVRGEVKGPR